MKLLHRMSKCLSLGILLLFTSSVAAFDCLQPVAGEVIVFINNDMTEDGVHEYFSSRDLELDYLKSDTFYVWLKIPQEFDAGKLRQDPFFRSLKMDKDIVHVLFDHKITDKYADQLFDTIPGVVINRRFERAPRKARIIVPAGSERQWIVVLEDESFVMDAFQNCASDYRKSCESYGGVIQRSGWEDENCELPAPPVQWDDVLNDKKAECNRVKGDWRVYADTCTDSCTFNKRQYCVSLITEDCDCGSYRCWYEKELGVDGSAIVGTCVDNPDWQGQYDNSF